MDRLEAMEIFVAAIEGGSLAAAAHRLGRSPATVTRAIAQLEQQAGDRLLHRTTRTLKLTGRGLQQLDVFRAILAELAALMPQPSSNRPVAGTLVVTAPELFGRLKAMPLIERFLAVHPAASVRVLLLNRVIDLGEEGVDVAIRLAALPDSRLVAVRLGEVRRLVCAAPPISTGKAGRNTQATSTRMNVSVTMKPANASYGRSVYAGDLETSSGPFQSGVDSRSTALEPRATRRCVAMVYAACSPIRLPINSPIKASNRCSRSSSRHPFRSASSFIPGHDARASCGHSSTMWDRCSERSLSVLPASYRHRKRPHRAT